MFFSVLVPVYNVENLLDRCVKSILAQTEQDFQLILANDGSTDKSPQICDNYAAKYPQKVKVIHKKNEGLLLTRRTLLSHATGAYIVWVDSDDDVDLILLECLKEQFIKYNYDMVLFDRTRINLMSLKGQSESVESLFSSDLVFNTNNKKILYELLLTGTKLNSMCIKSYKRKLSDTLIDYKQYYYVNIWEDLLQTIPILIKAKSIAYIHKPLYHYWTNTDSMLHSFHPNIYQSKKAALMVLKRFLREFDIDNAQELLNIRLLENAEMAVKELMRTTCLYKKQERKNYLDRISNDKDFREAYELCGKTYYSQVLDMLYGQHFSFIYIYISVLRARECVKYYIKKVLRFFLSNRG